MRGARLWFGLCAATFAFGCDGGAAAKPGRDAGIKDADSGGGVCTYDPNAVPKNCPDDVPNACANPAPSYGADVSNVIAEHCQPCHRPGGLAPDKPFESYDQVYKERRTVLDRVKRCVMPPACAPQPSALERQALLQWLVCSAPNN